MTRNNSPKPRVPTRPGQVIKHGKDKQREHRPSQAELFNELEEERNDNQHRPYPSEEEEEYYANKVYGGTHYDPKQK